MGSTYRPDLDDEPPRRPKPKRRRGIADALREFFSSEGVGFAAAKSAPAPNIEPTTARDIGVETDFVPLDRPEPPAPTGAQLVARADQRAVRDATATPASPSGIAATEEPASVSYRDPMGVAQSRAELDRIASGKKTTRSDGSAYTDEERALAGRLSQNLRARVDREEAKGGVGRRAASGLSLGGVNAPLQRDINRARREDNLVTEEDLRALDVRTREGETIRTEPTFREGLIEELPSMAGELPYYVLGPVAAEGRLLTRAGTAIASRGGRARSIGEALGRIGRDEITSPTALGRAGQRAARGAVQGSGVGAGLSVARRAQEGETAEEIAAALPLETVMGSGVGSVIDPVLGAAFDVGRAGVRAARNAAGNAAIRARSRGMTVEDMEIPTPGVRETQPPGNPVQDHVDRVRRAVDAAERMAASPPREQADATRQMLADMEIKAATRSIEETRAREEQAAIEQQQRAPLAEVTARVREEANAPEPTPEAKAYREAIDKVVQAEVAYHEQEQKLGKGRVGTRAHYDLMKAKDVLKLARENYAAQTGAVAIAALAANNDDLTEEERGVVGLAGLAVAGTTAPTIMRPAQKRALLDVFRKATPELPETGAAARDWLEHLDNDAYRYKMSGDEFDVLSEALTAKQTELGRDLTIADVEQVIGSFAEREPGRAFFRSRLVDWIRTKSPNQWEKTAQPAQTWIDKISRTQGAFTKQEWALLEPALKAAAAEKKKLTRADVVAMAEEVAPQMRLVSFTQQNRNRGLVRVPDEIPPGTVAVPLAEVQRAVDAGEMDAATVAVQVVTRRQRVQEIEARMQEISDQLSGGRLQQAEEEFDAAREAWEDVGGRAGNLNIWRPERVLTDVRNRILEDLTPSDAVDRALEDVDIDYDMPDYDARQLVSDSGYTIHDDQTEWVIYRPERQGLLGPEERREITRVTREEAEDHGLDPDNATEEEILDLYRRMTGDEDDIEMEPEHFAKITRDGDDAEEWRGEVDELDEAVSSLISENNLDESIIDEARDQAHNEAREVLLEYAEAYSRLNEAESEVERIREAEEEDPELDDDTRAALNDERGQLERERDRMRLEREELRSLVNRAPAEVQRRLPATTAAEEDEFTRPLQPRRDADTEFSSYQRINQGAQAFDYAELPTLWENGPRGDEQYDEPHSWPIDVPNMVGHVRRESHRMPKLPAGFTAARLAIDAAEPEGIRVAKESINKNRDAVDEMVKERNRVVAKLEHVEQTRAADVALLKRHSDGESLSREDYQRVQKLREELTPIIEEYTEIGKQIAETARKEEKFLSRIASELGIAENEVVGVMIESQSRYGADAVSKGVRRPEPPDEKAERLKKLEAAKKVRDELDAKYTELHKAANALDIEMSEASTLGDGEASFSLWRDTWRSERRAKADNGELDWDAYYNNALPYFSELPFAMFETIDEWITNRQPPGALPGGDRGLHEFVERFPRVREMWTKARRVKLEYDRVARERDTVYRQHIEAERAVRQLEEPPYQEGVMWSPFLSGSFKKRGKYHDVDTTAAYRVNAARYLMDSAERGISRIAWSDSANRVQHALHTEGMTAEDALGNMKVAKMVYDEFTPSAMKKILAELGFPDVKVEHMYIGGWGHWTIEFTPAMRAAVRRVGIPILSLLALMSPEELSAQEPDSTESSEATSERRLNYYGVGAGAIAMAAIAWLAKSRAARLTVARNPKLRAAHRTALRVAHKYNLRPDFAFQRREPVGREYVAPLDVKDTKSGRGRALFNVEKMGLTSEGEVIWRDIVDQLRLKKRHVSWDETIEEANRRVPTIEDLLHEKPWTGTDALAARMFQSQASQRLADLAATLPNLTGEEQALVRAEMDRVTVDIADIATRAAGERERAGRTLNTYKIIAKHNMDEATWQTLAQRAKGDLPMTSDEILKVRSLTARNDREGLTAFVSSLHKSTTLDKWLTFWKAGLLTSIGTHAVNLASNAAEAALIATSQPVAVAVDAVVALARGTLREKALPRGWFTSRLKGMKIGGREALQVLKTGVHPDEIGKWDVRRTNYDSPVLQAYTETVFRLLGASDRVFYNIALEASLDELTTLVARRALRSMPKNFPITFDQVYGALRADPPNELALRAADEATRAVFQNSGTLATMARGLLQGLRAKGGSARLAVETTIPFTRTPANIATRFADTSPLGFVTAILRQIDDKNFDQRRFSEDIARAMVGSGGLMLLGYWLAENDMATGSAPTNPSQREVWRSLGKRAHSVKIGGRWYNAARLGASGMTVAAGAQLHALAHEHADKQGVEFAWALTQGMAGTVGRVMLDQSFLLGVSRGLETIADPVRHGDSFMSGVAGSLVPATVGRAAQASDPLVREARGPGERVQSRIPGASRGLRPALDVFGQPMTRTKTDRAITMVDPLYSSRVQPEDETARSILEELDRLGVGVPRVPKHRNLIDPQTGERFRVSYTAEEQHEVLSGIGPRRRDFLERLMLSEAYANMPDDVRAREARRMLDMADEEFYARDDRRRFRERTTAAAPPQP